MKKLRIILLALMFPMISTAQSIKGVDFKKNQRWETIKEAAKAEGKLIFMDVYATWCGPCKKMDHEVYTNDSLGNYLNSEFISIKVQMDSNSRDNEEIRNNYAFASKIISEYKISILPTFLFFDANGELIHRDQGLYTSTEFVKICKTAADPKKNYSTTIKDYQNGTLVGADLLKLAQKLREFKEDSLALEVFKKYKSTVLSPRNPKDILDSSILPIINEFPQSYSKNDVLIQYIYHNQQEADKAVKKKGFAQNLIDYLALRDIVIKRIRPDEEYVKVEPDWNSIEKNTAAVWDKEVAARTILRGQIAYYSHLNAWDSLAKYHTLKIDHYGIADDVWAAFEVNNMVWDVIFKHSEDPKILKKGIHYMEMLLERYPNDEAKLDTYANVLYKNGQKSKALMVERKALNLAQSSQNKDNTKIFSETIQKMEKDIPTWN